MKKRILSLLVSAALLGTAAAMPVLAEGDIYNTTYVIEGNDVFDLGNFYGIPENYRPGLVLQKYLSTESKGTIADPDYYFFVSVNTQLQDDATGKDSFSSDPFQIVLTNNSDQDIEGRFFVCSYAKYYSPIVEMNSQILQSLSGETPLNVYDKDGNEIQEDIKKIPANESINLHHVMVMSDTMGMPYSLQFYGPGINTMGIVGFMLTNPEDLTSEVEVTLELQTFPGNLQNGSFALIGEPVTRFSVDYTFQPLEDGTSLNDTVEENVDNSILENNGFETEDGTYAKMDVVKVYKTDAGTLGGIDVTYKYNSTDNKNGTEGTVEYVPETTITGPTSVLLGVLVYNIPNDSNIEITKVAIK